MHAKNCYIATCTKMPLSTHFTKSLNNIFFIDISIDFFFVGLDNTANISVSRWPRLMCLGTITARRRSKCTQNCKIRRKILLSSFKVFFFLQFLIVLNNKNFSITLLFFSGAHRPEQRHSFSQRKLVKLK